MELRANWLDHGKYLLYRADGVGYIYGVAERRKAVFPPPPFQRPFFTGCVEMSSTEGRRFKVELGNYVSVDTRFVGTNGKDKGATDS